MTTLNSIWTAALSDLRGQMTEATYDQWLANTRLIALADGTATVEVACAQAREWLEARLNNRIEAALSDAVQAETNIECRYVVREVKPLPDKNMVTQTKLGGFTPIFDVVSQKLGVTAALVFGLVWRHCEMRNGVCYASHETMAELPGISRRSVIRHLAALCEAGYLIDMTPDVKHRPHIYKDAGRLKVRVTVEAYEE